MSSMPPTGAEQAERLASNGNSDDVTRCPQPNKQDPIEVTQLIDLTDKPISLMQDAARLSSVRMSASNCICYCCDSSMTLITTDKSYVVDEIPIEHIKAAQVNSSLRYIALANDKELAVIDMIENTCRQASGLKFNNNNNNNGEVDRSKKPIRRLVDLDAAGLSMCDILFWRWIDEVTLALISIEALYICQVGKAHINHPATTALNRSPVQKLPLEIVCELQSELANSDLVTNVQRDASANLYAISGLVQSRLRHQKDQSQYRRYMHKLKPSVYLGKTNDLNGAQSKSSLKSNSKSVPNRLSMLNNAEQRGPQTKFANFSSIESLRRISSQKLYQLDSILKSSYSQAKTRHDSVDDGLIETRGNTQIFCKLRDRSQIISAQAVAFTTTNISDGTSTISGDVSSNDLGSTSFTALIAANRAGNILRVYFIGMATTPDLSTSGQDTARSIDFDTHCDGEMDFPIKIVCTELIPDDSESHVAMILTKFGHLIVCSIKQSSILLMIQVSHDIISDAVLEDRSRGLMLVCRNGRVLLVRLNEGGIYQSLQANRQSGHVRIQHCASESNVNELYADDGSAFIINDEMFRSFERRQEKTSSTDDSESTDWGIEILTSTKL